MTEDELKQLGFVQGPDGWAKPKRQHENNQPVAGLHNPELEHRKIPTLASGSPPQKRGAKGVVKCVVTIVSYRSKILDTDNLIGGCKALTDAVSEFTGLDDGDPRIRFEYDQIQTSKGRGTHVLITEL